nr:reverse transcriptase domain-containing protein [Tanacetum cinerariifolium]
VVIRTQAQHREAIRGIFEHLQGVPIEEEMSTLRFKMGMAKAKNASLRGKIKNMEAIETITHSQEKGSYKDGATVGFSSEVTVTGPRELQEALGGKENVATDALSRKERIKPLRVRALVMTIDLDLPKQILNAQNEALKPQNLKHKYVGGMIRKDIPKEKLEIE